MSVMVSEITSVSIVCSIICSGADQTKHQSSTSLAFVRGIHRSPVDSPHKGPVMWKMFLFDDVIMFMGPELVHHFTWCAEWIPWAKMMGASHRRLPSPLNMNHGQYQGSKLIWTDDEWTHGPWFNIKMSSYQYRKSHCGDKTVVRSSYLHNGISYAGKMTSLYWIRALDLICVDAGLIKTNSVQAILYIHRSIKHDQSHGNCCFLCC